MHDIPDAELEDIADARLEQIIRDPHSRTADLIAAIRVRDDRRARTLTPDGRPAGPQVLQVYFGDPRPEQEGDIIEGSADDEPVDPEPLLIPLPPDIPEDVHPDRHRENVETMRGHER